MGETSETAATKEHAYACVEKACSARGTLIHTTMSPRDYRLATGRFVSCGTCGAVMVWKSSK